MGVKKSLLLAAKGMMMGAADAVPGVSGGTVAFMTGIYQELIESLKRCGEAPLVLYKQGLRAAWQHANGNFLAVLFGGVLCSLVLFSRAILYLLDQYPELVWSFFFGLVLASGGLLFKQVAHWRNREVTALALGAIAAYLITSVSPATLAATPVTLFLGGAIAICAMILPGISGSFILLLMGLYAPVMEAVKAFDVTLLGTFMVGCVIGLLSFSRVLSWMFHHYASVTLALLGGFMLGSLNKLWPWKQTISYTLDRHGKQVPLVQENLLPSTFEQITGHPSQLLVSIALMLLAVVLVIVVERIGRSDQS